MRASHCSMACDHRRRTVQRVDGHAERASRHQPLVAGQARMLDDLGDRVAGLAQLAGDLLDHGDETPGFRQLAVGSCCSSSGMTLSSAPARVAPAARLAAVQAHQHAGQPRRRLDPALPALSALASASSMTVRASANWPSSRSTSPSSGSSGRRRGRPSQAARPRGATGCPPRARRRARTRDGRPTPGGARHRRRSRGPSGRAARARRGSCAPARGGSRGSPRTRAPRPRSALTWSAQRTKSTCKVARVRLSRPPYTVSRTR